MRQRASSQKHEGTIPVLLTPDDLPHARRMALFLDFDGTLVEIADEPDAVSFDGLARDVLAAVSRRLGGAVAIISGRDIADIDRHLAPLVLPVAGMHGLVRRRADGTVVSVDAPDGKLAELRALVDRHATHLRGVFVERKTAGVALHYRRDPEQGAACQRIAAEAVELVDGFEIKRGKMVVEIKARGADKGSALTAFMQEPPFAGRVPVVAGDDVTDEDAFAVVNGLGGLSIKIGAGETAARHRLATTAELLAWLAAIDAG